MFYFGKLMINEGFVFLLNLADKSGKLSYDK